MTGLAYKARHSHTILTLPRKRDSTSAGLNWFREVALGASDSRQGLDSVARLVVTGRTGSEGDCERGSSPRPWPGSQVPPRQTVGGLASWLALLGAVEILTSGAWAGGAVQR